MPRDIPRRAWVLLGALVLITVVVLSVVLWAQLSGSAGVQRGLVITNKAGQTAIVALNNGQSHTLLADHQATFVVKRDELPTAAATGATPEPALHVVAKGIDGTTIAEKVFAYHELSEAEFRISFDVNGFYYTQEVRDTPAPID